MHFSYCRIPHRMRFLWLDFDFEKAMKSLSIKNKLKYL